MTEATRDLLERALELPPAERVAFVRQIRASLDDENLDDEDEDEEGELDPAFAAELRRRIDNVSEPGIPADEAVAELDRRHAERRRLRDQAS